MKSACSSDPLAKAHIEVLDGFFSVEPALGEEGDLKGYLFSTIKENISLVSDNIIQLSILRLALSQQPQLFNRSLDKLYGLLQLNRCPPAGMLALVKSLKKINDLYYNNSLMDGDLGLKPIYEKFRFNTHNGITNSTILRPLVRAYLDDKVDEFIHILFPSLAVEVDGDVGALFDGVPSYTAWREIDETLSYQELVYHHLTQHMLQDTASGNTSRFQEYFIQHQMDVNSVNSHGETALLVAASKGYYALATLLLAAGANVNAVDADGWTALYWAALRGHIAMVDALLAAGANVNAVCEGGATALLFAASMGHVTVVTALLEAGANVNATHGKGGATVLMLAVIKGHYAVVTALLEAGANVNATHEGGATALMLAVMKGHYAVVSVFLAAGADVNLRDKSGRSALDHAQKRGDARVVALIEQHLSQLSDESLDDAEASSSESKFQP